MGVINYRRLYVKVPAPSATGLRLLFHRLSASARVLEVVDRIRRTAKSFSNEQTHTNSQAFWSALDKIESKDRLRDIVKPLREVCNQKRTANGRTYDPSARRCPTNVLSTRLRRRSQ